MVRLNEIRRGETGGRSADAAATPKSTSSVASARRGRRASKHRARAGSTGRPAASSWPNRGIAALDSIAEFERLEVLYWLHQSRRDLIHQSPRNDGAGRGVFSLRTPVRPNPIGTSIVKLEKIEGPMLFVRGLDCLDGTPLVDLKPDRTLFEPLAPPQAGDFQVGDK